MKETGRPALDVGIDVGGTFTDVVMVGADGRFQVTKGPTDTEDQSVGAFQTVAMLNEPVREVRAIVHGTTVATNAILERKGSRLAVLTTRGFRDVLEMQRQDRANIWDLYSEKIRPLAPRHLRYEVDERILADGTVRRPLDLFGLKTVASEMEKAKVDAVAICFLNAFANPTHEIEAAELLSGLLPNVYLTRSSFIAPHFREYERMSTTAISAYVGPKIAGYLRRFRKRFETRGFSGQIYVMGSNGGVLPLDGASARAGTTCLSGPAGGVLAAQAIARSKGLENVVSFDMGGTSTDVCLISDAQATISTRRRINGLPITLPMFAIETVSAGGGSIAAVDAGGLLKIGPESAGAQPGPACYGRGGTEPTVTDALCVTGLLRPESFFAGRMKLDRDAAEAAFLPLARRFGKSPAEVAGDVLTIANVKMANTVRVVSVREGHDPRDFAIIAFGGAGPLHACQVAEELGVGRIIVPRYPGAFSALGLLSADLRSDHMQTRPCRLSTIDDRTLGGWFGELRESARAEVEQIAAGRAVYWDYHADLRYVGQASEIAVPVAARGRPNRRKIIDAFHRIHRAKFGFADPEVDVELINLRVTGYAAIDVPRLPSLARRRKDGPARTRHPLALPGMAEGAFIHRDALGPGDSIEGPAVINEATATTFLPRRWRLSVDSDGYLDLARTENGRA